MLAILVAAVVYQVTAVKVIDGDTLKVHVAGWPAPFDPIDVRIYGVDAPEHQKPPAQTKCEVALGLKASAFAKTLVVPGEALSVTWSGKHDKYGRLLGSVTLPDGRDWAQVMIASKLGRPYGADGRLRKARWC